MRVQIASCILFCCCLLLAKTSSEWGSAGRTTQLLEVAPVEPSTSFDHFSAATAMSESNSESGIGGSSSGAGGEGEARNSG